MHFRIKQIHTVESGNNIFIPQTWHWWWPFWMSITQDNGHYYSVCKMSTMEDAKAIIEVYRRKCNKSKSIVAYHNA